MAMRVFCCGLTALACASLALAEPPAESLIRVEGDRVWLSTRDGLSLLLDARTGYARQWRLGDWPVGLAPGSLIRFEEVVECPDAPDTLGGMSAEAWGLAPEALEEMAQGHAGPWLRVEGGGDQARRTVRLDQETAQPLVLSGWCQTAVSAEALGWWNRSLALNATGVHADGEPTRELSAYFGQYEHGPQFNKRVICPDRPLAALDLELTALAGDCTAWYRDVRLSPARYAVTVPEAPMRRVDAAVLQEFECTAAGLRSWGAYQPMRDCIEVRGVIESARPEDRAISVYVDLPFDAVGGRWHDHFRAYRVIEPGKVYRDEDQRWYYGAGRDGYNSVYPVACVEAPDGPGLAVALPMDEPRLFQTEYDADARALRLRFDLGLSPDAGVNANRATFTARVFLYDPEDGFREAAERYHRMYPWAFEKRVEREGTWLAFLSPSFIPGDPDDFQFRFVEAVANMGWEQEQGMYTLYYTLPICHVHEFPGHISAPEVHGPALPEASLALARRTPELEGLPEEMYRRYQAYPGAYAADKWGQPNGFFFRNPEGGRNENMMLTNPSIKLPPPPGAAFSFGGYEREMIREAMGISHQWHIPGWRMGRVTARSYFEVDPETVAEGARSLRLDVAESKNYFEQHLRRLSQDVYLGGPNPRQITVSLQVRSDTEAPAKQDEPRVTLTFWDTKAGQSSEHFPVTPVSTEWQSFAVTAEVPALTEAVTVSIGFAHARFNPLVIWLDDVSLSVDGGPNRLQNGGFEEAELLPGQLDGLYLDIIEGYWGDLNYRRDHWLYAEAPLTFDSAREPALLQVHTHTAFTRQMARWLLPKGMILFGNCAPTTPFTAPYLDVLGDEQFWKHGDTWSPRDDGWFNFARFMSRAKPYNILQYSDLSVEEQTRYVKRCLFYGMFPSNQADPDGQWFWANPVMVARHRPVFREYVPHIIEVATAGWQPLTLARSDNRNVWLERFGEGEVFYLTAFNPSDTPQTATIALDARAGAGETTGIEERLSGESLPWSADGPGRAFTLSLNPEDVAVIRIANL